MKLPIFLVLGVSAALAQPGPSGIPKIKYSDTRLENGLRVLIVEDHYAPLYAICVAYKVGSKDERKGRTGFAHLFEHMMFKGSENVGPGELDFLIYTNGGNSNGTTNTDRTSYYEVLPKNQLDLGLYLEADRMRGLAITKENLENQRQAVKEERRLRGDNQAYGNTSEKLEELIYDNFAYHHSVIGSMEDLDAAGVEDVKQFFKTYYAPNNAVLALVGDLNTADTLAKVKKYFTNRARQHAVLPSLAILLALGASAIAQEPEAASTFRGMVRLNRAPVSNEVLKVKLPRPVERQLANGLKLLILESHRAPAVSLTISIPSSALRDPEGLPGVAEATAAMMMMGTATRTQRQISEALADIGVTVSFGGGGGGGGRGGRGGGGGGEGSITVSALTEHFDEALAIMSDALLHASFPADEFERWKARQRSTLEQTRTQPSVLSSETLMRVLYPGDARRVARLTAESLAKLTRENLVEHHKKYYVPAGEFAGISGDITPRDAVSKLEKALSGWKGGPLEKLKLPMNPPIAEKKVYLVSRPGSVQTDITLANRAIDRTNPDYLACMVMNQVLGSGPAARLFRIIREEKGYTYGVSSSFTATRTLGHFSSAMSVRTEVTEPALADLLAEFKEIRDVPVPKLELDGAKRTLVASFALSLENPAQVLARWIQQREFGLPEDYWDNYTDKIAAITAEDVARVAKKYVPYNNVQIIAVGDGAKIRDLLKKFGPVEEKTID